MMHYLVNTEIVQNIPLNEAYYLLEVKLPEEEKDNWHPEAGMFVQVHAKAPNVLLRRPLSIAYYKEQEGIIGMLIQKVGKASNYWSTLPMNTTLSLVGPLGNSFTTDSSFVGSKPLLVAGGVGVAPIRMLAEKLASHGIVPTIFYGARTQGLLVFTEELSAWGNLKIATEDGSAGTRGYVTSLPDWGKQFTSVYTCGPRVMMNAVARLAKEKGIPCEVSLENRMACGIGACLCCVEETTEGNLCVCTEGPVFNANRLID